jgi:hypothetical protein
LTTPHNADNVPNNGRAYIAAQQRNAKNPLTRREAENMRRVRAFPASRKVRLGYMAYAVKWQDTVVGILRKRITDFFCLKNVHAHIFFTRRLNAAPGDARQKTHIP